MLPENVNVDEISQLFGCLTEEQEDSARALINVAWSFLKAKIPTVEARAESDKEYGFLAGNIVNAAVVRVLRNPEGWRQVGLDDFQGVRDSALSTGAISFTDEELNLLKPVETVGGVFTVPMSVPYWGL